jgi:hypothetical protein
MCHKRFRENKKCYKNLVSLLRLVSTLNKNVESINLEMSLGRTSDDFSYINTIITLRLIIQHI